MPKLFMNAGKSKNFNKSKVIEANNPLNRAWLEVNPKAIETNTSNIKKQLHKNCLLMAVVKG